MSPSDMVLDITRGVAGYNNKILTSDNITQLGHRPDVNSETAQHTSLGGPETGNSVPDDDFGNNAINPPATKAEVGQPPVITPEVSHNTSGTSEVLGSGTTDHEDEKIALVLVGTALFAAGLYFWRGRLM
jgi:hypothetical protein